MCWPPVLPDGFGSAVAAGLRDDHRLRLTDRQNFDAAGGADVVVGDLADPAFVATAVGQVDAVVHIAGNPSARAAWDELYPANVVATRLLFERAAQAGVTKIVYMSSNHATGLYDRDQTWPVDPDWPPRPCCLHGVTKVFGETLGRFYAESGGPSVVCLRLGLFQPKPRNARGVQTWVSRRDTVGFVRHGLTAGRRYGIYYAVSANTRRHWKIDNAVTELNYQPQDDSEQFVPELDMTTNSSPPCYRGFNGDNRPDSRPFTD